MWHRNNFNKMPTIFKRIITTILLVCKNGGMVLTSDMLFHILKIAYNNLYIIKVIWNSAKTGKFIKTEEFWVREFQNTKAFIYDE